MMSEAEGKKKVPPEDPPMMEIQFSHVHHVQIMQLKYV